MNSRATRNQARKSFGTQPGTSSPLPPLPSSPRTARKSIRTSTSTVQIAKVNSTSQPATVVPRIQRSARRQILDSSSDSEVDKSAKRSKRTSSVPSPSRPSTSKRSQSESSGSGSSHSNDTVKGSQQKQVRKRIQRRESNSDDDYSPPATDLGKGKTSLHAVASTSTQDPNDRRTKAMKAKGLSQSFKEAQSTLKQGSHLKNLVNKCAFYMLVADQKKHAIKKSDIVKYVFENENTKEYYSQVLTKANDFLMKNFGLEILEVKNQKNHYILINILDTDHDLGIGDLAEYSPLELQKRGFLFLLLTIIYMNENVIKEEKLWKALEPLGIHANSTVSHPIFGNVKKFVTVELVRQMYLQYTCINKDPPQFEFTWGERAVQEVGKEELLEFACKMMGDDTKPEDWKLQYMDATRAKTANVEA